MTDNQPFEEMKAESSHRGKDPKTRRILIVLLALWLITLLGLIAVAWNAYFQEKEKSQTLAQQIAVACESGDLGTELSPEDRLALCENAEKVIENDPELQDEEIQESEIQDPEIQDPEIQDPEIQDKENQNRESQDIETQEPEIQEIETQNPEIQDEETQDPEVNDPDPNDPPARHGTYMCPDGQVLQGMTFHEDGTVTQHCVDNNFPQSEQGEGNGR